MKKIVQIIQTSAHQEGIVQEAVKAVGAQPGDSIEIVAPQFGRPAGYPSPGSAPRTQKEWEALASMSEVALREMGLGPWGTSNKDDDGNMSGPMLWLFPGEWYTSIPAGLEIVNIFFEHLRFIPGETDDDIRFGCLSFGVLRTAQG